MLIVLPRLGFTSAVECQGCNNNISRDRFYYDNHNDYNNVYRLIFERYYAWLSLKDKVKRRNTSRKTIKDSLKTKFKSRY